MQTRFLSSAAYWLILTIVTLGPWCFGAWEVWWFWPFFVLICAAVTCLGLRMTLWTLQPGTVRTPAIGGRQKLVILSALPFLVYAFVRCRQTEVFATAERSFLLFLGPALVYLVVALAVSSEQRTRLHRIVMVNLLLLGLYGVINHVFFDSRHVLWMPGFENYTREHRATGSYYCPDHYSGLMEIALGLSLGVLLSRDADRRWKCFAGALAVVAFCGVVLSKSRGGGLSVVVLAVAAMVLGLGEWRQRSRWLIRGWVSACLALVLFIAFQSDAAYMTRFKDHFGWTGGGDRTPAMVARDTVERLKASCRGQMIAGALRAWKSSSFSVWFGIGPGMHQHLWQHFAASPDGDREKGIWPTNPNYNFHSYEVHSDWVQLLEEYGVIGVLLAVAPLAVVCVTLFRAVRLLRRRRRSRESGVLGMGWEYACALGGMLALVALVFHSLGDFNLQIPATGWILAAIVAAGVESGEKAEDDGGSRAECNHQ